MNRNHHRPPGAKDEESEEQELESAIALASRVRHGGNQEPLAEMMRSSPVVAREVEEYYGDLGAQVANANMDWALKGADIRRTVTGHRFETVRQELTGPKRDPLVALLAERTALCWLQGSLEDEAEARYLAGGEISLANRHYLRGQTAQRRFLEAARSLALVRRILEDPNEIIQDCKTPDPEE